MSYFLLASGAIGLSTIVFIQYRNYQESVLKTTFLSVPDRAKFFLDIHQRIAEHYEYEMKEYEWAKRIDKYRKVLCSYSEGKTLEVGIGTGLNFGFYSPLISLTGIDWSEKMLEKSKENLKGRTKLMKMDARELKFEDESFDSVVASFVLSSSDTPEKVIKEMERVCKKGGKVLILDRGRSDDSLNSLWLDLYRFENLFKFGYDQCANIEKIVKKSGLTIEVEEQKQGNTIYFYILSKPN